MHREDLFLMESRWNHLEEDLSRHGEAVGNDGLFIRRLALPAVQLQAAAPGQQTLSVHLRRGHAGELASCGETGKGKKKKASSVSRSLFTRESTSWGFTLPPVRYVLWEDLMK